MRDWLTTFRGCEGKRARAFRAQLRVEQLEERNLLTQGLVFVPSPVISESQLIATAAIAHNDIWAVGGIVTSSGGRTTLAEHFNGTSWGVVPTPAINDALVSVAAAASNDVWAIGNQIFVVDSPTPFITHWNGASWSVVDSPKLPKNSFLTGVTAPASNNAWVIGNTFGSSSGIFEHWDGTSWRIVSSPAFTNVVAFAISADSSTDVWAFGISNVTAGPVALHFNGTSWTAIAAANSRFGFEVEGIAALSPTNVWAVGASATGEPLDTLRPAAEHWDGTSWSFVSVPNPDAGTRFRDFLSGVAAISANDIWAVGGTSSGTLTEHWDGTAWSIIPSPDPGKLGNSLSGVTALSDGTVAAVGSQVTSKDGMIGLVLQNAAPAPPKKTAIAAALITTMAAPVDAAPVPMAGTTTASPTRTMPAALDAATVGQFLATAEKGEQPVPVAAQRSMAQAAAAIWDLSLLPQEIWLFDQN